MGTIFDGRDEISKHYNFFALDGYVFIVQKGYKAEKEADPFYRMKGFLNQLAENFQRWYNPGQFLSGDEGVFDFKGRHRARCYNAEKPTRFRLYRDWMADCKAY